jgi:uncharacterized protein (DUF1800 family)
MATTHLPSRTPANDEQHAEGDADGPAMDDAAGGPTTAMGRRRAFTGLVTGGLIAAASACNVKPAPARRVTSSIPPGTAPPTVPPTTAPPTTAPPTTSTPTTAPPTTAPPTTTPPVNAPAPPTTLTLEHTARRLTYGPTPEVRARIGTLGPVGWIDEQLTMPASADADLDAQIRTSFPRTFNDAVQNFALGEAWEIVSELPAATTVRAVCARRQLFELTVAFLWDHFSVDVQNDRAQASCGAFDQLLRAGALGRFRDLLLEVARSAAMMNYLNQATSRADGSNVPIENFARELMELHTVGVDGGYDEDDVKAVAYLLSGWTRQLVDWQPIGPFTFNPAVHRLGWSRGTLTGEAAGASFIDHLASHPTTAQRLAHELAIRFIGDHVQRGDAVVTTAAQAYLDADTSIRALLRALLTSNEFAASANGRIRRPLELWSAMVRTLAGTGWDGARMRESRWGLVGATSSLNQVPHWWPDPDGYPDRDANWVGVGAMIGRWNMATWVVRGMSGVFSINWTEVRNWTAGSTIGEWFAAACQRTGVTVSTAARDRMLAELYRTADSPLTQGGNQWAMENLLIQILQAPDFQTR